MSAFVKAVLCLLAASLTAAWVAVTGEPIAAALTVWWFGCFVGFMVNDAARLVLLVLAARR